MAGSRGTAPQPAFVLHHHDWSESSLILDLFTRGQGRVVAAAKGAKRPYSQLRAVLLPFQRLQVTLGKLPDGGEVQNLRQAEWAGGGAMPSGAALFAGFYLNELLMKLLARHDPHPLLFDAYAQTLPWLDGDDETVEAALRAFELVLLRETGSLPELGVATLTQQPLRADRRYALRGEAGVIEAADEASLGAGELVGLQAALEHGSLAVLQQACRAALPALKQQLRALLHYHLGSSVLRTRQVMLDVQQLE
ncbi:MAG: DNA repair protein RecO [Piscinibacter sp.]|nr:DNA repair protein RecO [Piscinibacter sp.]